MGDFLNKILLEGPGSETKNNGLHFDPDPDFFTLFDIAKQASHCHTNCLCEVHANSRDGATHQY